MNGRKWRTRFTRCLPKPARLGKQMVMGLTARALRKVGIGAKAKPSVRRGEFVDQSGFFTKYTVPGPDGLPYLTRWYLYRSSGIKIYLHKLSQSDADRELHDHPWRFMSILLKGPGYTEHLPKGKTRKFGPYSVNVRDDAAEPHRVELPVGRGPQWTLVFVGPKVREWGFHVPVEHAPPGKNWHLLPKSKFVDNAVWVDHQTFLDNRVGVGKWPREPFYYEEKAVPLA